MVNVLLVGEVNRLDAMGSAAAAGDYIPVVDVSAGDLKKVTKANLVEGASVSALTIGAATITTATITTANVSGTTTSDKFVMGSETGTTTANLSSGGQSIIGSTSAGTKAYTLDAPSAGLEKFIYCNAGSTDNLSSVTADGATFDGTNDVATFNAAGDALHLVGASSVLWNVIVNTGSVSLST